MKHRLFSRTLPLLLASALIGSCSVEDKAGLSGSGVTFNLGGVTTMETETRAAFIDTASYRTVAALGDGLAMECILQAETPSLTRASQPFTAGNTFRIFSQVGSTVTDHGAYAAGSSDIRLTGLTPGSYTFSAYSYNDATAVGSLPSHNAAQCIDNIAPDKDLLHWKGSTVSVSSNSVPTQTITFLHKFPQVQVTVNATDKTDTSIGLPITAINATLSPNSYAKMEVTDGSLSAGTSGSYSPVLTWNNLGTSQITSAYQGVFSTVFSSGGSDNLVFTMSSVTVDGTAYTGKAVTFSGVTLVAGKRYTMTVNIRKPSDSTDPGDLDLGTGSFSGKRCFDIAYSNDNTNSCAALSTRTSQKTDFSDRTVQDPVGTNASRRPFSGVQVYTFTPSGSVSNVRFMVSDPNSVIASITPNADYSGSVSSGSACKVTVSYKSSLNNDLQGLTRANALKATLYAVYNNGTKDVSLPLSVRLQDCACCGAATTSGGWLTFMCHNLGADESLDPFTYVSNGDAVDNDIKGYLYQWGRQSDGHQLRSSSTTTTLATSNIPGHSSFIVASSYPYDWRSGGGETSRWGDGTTNENMAKATNDPCPPGWKVPSQKQWASIFRGGTTSGAPGTATANTWTWTGNGYKVGDALFLPAAGFRYYLPATVNAAGLQGHYWSSTVNGQNAPSLLIYVGRVNPWSSGSHALGYSVRCVSE